MSQGRDRRRPPFDVVAIGTSLGGLEALSQVLGALPADFPVPILVVQHLSALYPSRLGEILLSRTRLAVKQARHGERLRPRTVYVAPPDRHLLALDGGFAGLSDSEKVEYVRPSINVLFQSVASRYGGRSIAVVLSGTLRDGADGARCVKDAGGRVLVQDRDTSAAFGMPGAAIDTGSVDFVLPAATIAHALVSLVMVRGGADLFVTGATARPRSASVTGRPRPVFA